MTLTFKELDSYPIAALQGVLDEFGEVTVNITLINDVELEDVCIRAHPDNPGRLLDRPCLYVGEVDDDGAYRTSEAVPWGSILEITAS